MVKHLDAHPLFVRIPDEELVGGTGTATSSFVMLSELILTFCLASYAYSRLMIPPWSMSAQPLRKARRWSATRETSTLLATAESPMRIKGYSWIENKKKEISTQPQHHSATPATLNKEKKLLCDRVPHYTASTIVIVIVMQFLWLLLLLVVT